MLDLRPLRSAGFRRLALGYWVNEFGNWIGEIALTILVYDRTGSPLGTAALFLALRFAPALFAPLLTARVETLTPRLVLTALYGGEAVLFACIALVAEHFSMPAVLALSILDGVLGITAKALSRSATAASLSEQKLLREGNAILNLGLMTSTACAPMIAGALVAWQGARSALLVDAGTFVVTAAIIAGADGLRVETDSAASFSERLRGGAQAVRKRAPVKRLMSAVALIILLGAVPLPIEVVFAKHTLHAGDLGYGALLGSWGVGMVAGAAVFATASSVSLTRLLCVGMFALSIGYGGLAISPTLAVACVASAIGGAGNGAGWIAAVTAIQERIPLNAQSSVMALFEGLNQVMPAIGFVIGGALTAISSPRLAYGVAAVGVALVVVRLAARPPDRLVLDTVGPPESPIERENFDALAQDSHVSQRTPSLPNLTTG
jgi:MFS family permease